MNDIQPATQNRPEPLWPELGHDPRDEKQYASQRELVHRQVTSLHTVVDDEAHFDAAVERLRGRRRGVPDVVQFESVSDGGETVLAQANRFVLRTRDTDTCARGRELLTGLRIRKCAYSAPFEGVEMFEAADHATRSMPCDVLDELRRMDVPISLNHVVPLSGRGGIILKGDGGPGRSEPSREFPKVVTPPKRDVVVAVLDTGISAERRTDGYLQDLLRTDNEDQLDVFSPVEGDVGGDGFLDAAAGHGTFVAGVVQQVAPAATLRIYRVADSDGVTTELDIAEQMLLAASDGADIINLSLGTGTLDRGPSLSLWEAVEQIERLHPNVLIVCAAGNAADTAPMWPAAFAGDTVPGSPHLDNVVSVAGLDPQGDPSTWSSRGGWVSFSTIGEGVVSTYVIGKEDPELIGPPEDEYGPDSWAVWSGTSFAAPQISGALARICQEDDVDPREARDRLRSLGEPVDGWGVKVLLLHGT